MQASGFDNARAGATFFAIPGPGADLGQGGLASIRKAPPRFARHLPRKHPLAGEDYGDTLLCPLKPVASR